MLYKPLGAVCTSSDDRGRKTVMQLLPEGIGRVFPVGRLDYATEGLLILTNDGDLAFRLTHPTAEIPKTYIEIPKAYTEIPRRILVSPEKASLNAIEKVLPYYHITVLLYYRITQLDKRRAESLL